MIWQRNGQHSGLISFISGGSVTITKSNGAFWAYFQDSATGDSELIARRPLQREAKAYAEVYAAKRAADSAKADQQRAAWVEAVVTALNNGGGTRRNAEQAVRDHAHAEALTARAVMPQDEFTPGQRVCATGVGTDLLAHWHGTVDRLTATQVVVTDQNGRTRRFARGANPSRSIPYRPYGGLTISDRCQRPRKNQET